MTTVEQMTAEFEQVNAQAAHVAPTLVPVLRTLEQHMVETRRRLEEIERMIHA